MPSPRNYNASIVEFAGQRIMAYRSHRMDQKGRCTLVVCSLNDDWEASRNQWLNLPEQVASQFLHHEDPRLFIFKDRLYLAYTETTFVESVQNYTCVMKYALLNTRGAGKKREWYVERVFWPRYGHNDGSHREKNWSFFEAFPGRLHFIYASDPHTVCELGPDGETVIKTTKTEVNAVRWPWGTIRGGTPPIRYGDEWLTVFHSSTPYPVPPHWRRYYSGAYTFKAEPPFAITAISHEPLLVGSAEDGHAHDPRQIDTWKPFVVFPNGIIQKDDFTYWVSYGVNDYMIAVAEHDDFLLGDPKFETWGPKYFATDNADRVRRMFVHENRPAVSLRFKPVGPRIAGATMGVFETRDPAIAGHLIDNEADVRPVDAAEYQRLNR